MDSEFTPRGGALRYWDAAGKCWRFANPGDTLYSTVTMVATEYWAPERGWTKIYDEEEGADNAS